jgi:CCDC81-like prokaryotic HU domain 1/CCDC81-like prokaryotic HU domain 2
MSSPANSGLIFDINMENRLSMYEEMGKHIARLLYKHDCVVVPNFGAFLTHYQSATLDAVSGAIVPPTKTLSFNTALNHNDGLLANAIAQQDAIAFADALQYIQHFTRTWQHDLSLQGILSIHKVGRFISDAQGRVQFLPEALNYNDDAYLLPTLYFAPIQQQKVMLDAEIEITTLVKNQADNRPSAPIRPLPQLRQKVKRWENAIVAAALLFTGVVLLYLISPEQKMPKTAKNGATKVQNTENTASVLPMPSISDLKPASVTTTPAFITTTTETPEIKVAQTVAEKPMEETVEKPIKTIKIAKASVITKPITIKSAQIIPEKVIENVPVERLNLVLGAYKSPANVAALQLRAKANNDVLVTTLNAKGLTVVSLTVQIKRSEIGVKIMELERIYGTRPIIK